MVKGFLPLEGLNECGRRALDGSCGEDCSRRGGARLREQRHHQKEAERETATPSMAHEPEEFEELRLCDASEHPLHTVFCADARNG